MTEENEDKTRVTDPDATLEPGQMRVRIVDRTGTEGVTKKQLKNEKVINFEYHSVEEGEVYSGLITLKRLTIQEQAAFESALARKNAGLTPMTAMEAMSVNTVLTSLEFQTKERPEWLQELLTGGEVYDMTVAFRLFEEVQTFNASFRRPV